VSVNCPTGFQIMQAVIDGRSPAEIAALHRTRAKRAEMEKSADVELPDYVRAYLREVLADVRLLNQRIAAGESDLLAKISAYDLSKQVELMCTVPGVTRMLSLRIIAEMGSNYHQRYHSGEAFAKGIGVVPSNEVSGGKLLKRRASHGNRRVKFHLLSATKAYAIHGRDPLHNWFVTYRGRSNYLKATSALARRIAEGLWWVATRNEPYKYWQGDLPRDGGEVVQLGNEIVCPATGEVLETIEPAQS
jgi:transposase